ncbi:hypothetical protein C8F01DRAFT_1238966 [Mycena amicta]|nr:hypothetical protein C8F01DRAFT_1240476 [Mycena amicta]KAJ7049091.1 hypothetical protein C8F01DRAFT_1238966 [Mycena amicta]
MWYTARDSHTTCCCKPQHTICEPIFRRSEKCTNDDAHDRHSTRYCQDAESVSSLFIRFSTKAAAVNYWHGWCRYHHTEQHPCGHAPIFEPDRLTLPPSLLPTPIPFVQDLPPAYSPKNWNDVVKRQVRAAPRSTAMTSPSSAVSTPSLTFSAPSSSFNGPPSTSASSPPSSPPSTVVSGDDNVHNISDLDDDEEPDTLHAGDLEDDLDDDDDETPETLRANYEEMGSGNEAEQRLLDGHVRLRQAEWRERCWRELTLEEEAAVGLLVTAERVAQVMNGAEFGQEMASLPSRRPPAPSLSVKNGVWAPQSQDTKGEPECSPRDSESREAP